MSQVTLQQLQAELEALSKENALLKAMSTQKSARGLSLRVSPKGALSIYGLGRFPVTLYKSQIKKLLDMKDEILGFVEANNAMLQDKSEQSTQQA